MGHVAIWMKFQFYLVFVQPSNWFWAARPRHSSSRVGAAGECGSKSDAVGTPPTGKDPGQHQGDPGRAGEVGLCRSAAGVANLEIHKQRRKTGKIVCVSLLFAARKLGKSNYNIVVGQPPHSQLHEEDRKK